MKPEFTNIERVLQKYSDAIIASLESKGIKRTSNLSQSLEVSKDVQPLKTIFEVLANEYWYYIDQGRGKTENGEPPGEVKEAIKRWIRREGIKAEERNGRTPTEDQLAFLITRKIHREGFPGRDFVSGPTAEIESELDKAFEEDTNIFFSKFAEEVLK